MARRTNPPDRWHGRDARVTQGAVCDMGVPRVLAMSNAPLIGGQLDAIPACQ